MARTVHDKLVRDLVPYRIQQNHGKPATRVLNDNAEFLAALKLKLSEEAHEVSVASTKVDIGKEVADVLEVLENLVATAGLTMEEVRHWQTLKRQTMGGFHHRIFLEHVDE